jgi:hypothetical protein
VPLSSTLPRKDTKLPLLPTPIKSLERQSTSNLDDLRLEHMEEMDTQEDVEDLTSVVVVVSPTAVEVVKVLPEDEVQDNLRMHESPSQSKPKRRHSTMKNLTKSTLYHTWSSFFLDDTKNLYSTPSTSFMHSRLTLPPFYSLSRKTKVQQIRNHSTHVVSRLMPCSFCVLPCIFTSNGMDCGCHATSLLRMGLDLISSSHVLKILFTCFSFVQAWTHSSILLLLLWYDKVLRSRCIACFLMECGGLWL